MKKQLLKSVVLLLAIFLTTNIASANTPIKKGILLVSFGSSYPETRVSFDNIEKDVKKAFPNVEIRWAYTSKIIRTKLRTRGENINSPAMALAQMAEDGFTHIAVQSLHIIPGLEYNNLKNTVKEFNLIPKSLKRITIGTPLLYKHKDNEKVAKAIKNIFASKLSQKDAFVFMGHGTEHISNIYYPGFEYYLKKESPKFVLGTVEGYPTLQNTINELKKMKAKTVYLTPLMSVAGDHARNDMAGNESKSWKTILEKNHFKVKSILVGLGEYDNIVDIWIEHLKIAFNELNK